MALLELNKLTKTFGGLAALSGFDLSVKKGEIMGLIGPNGAGKTTVFNLISGALRPTSGMVRFKDEDITGLKPHLVAKRGLIKTFQLTRLFDEYTVLENILLGFHLKSGLGIRAALFNTNNSKKRKKELYQKALELAESMGLDESRHEKAKNLPHGFQKLLDFTMSMAADPELLLLDEPVTGMTASEIKIMMDKIIEVRNKGITVLLVEHHMKVVMDICDRICVLNFGKKIASGSPEEVSQNKNVILAYLGKSYAAGN